jgi:hypothetical protein
MLFTPGCAESSCGADSLGYPQNQARDCFKDRRITEMSLSIIVGKFNPRISRRVGDGIENLGRRRELSFTIRLETPHLSRSFS